MISVSVALSDGVPLFEVAVPCEIFGRDRPDLADSWYDFTICAPDKARVGGWFTTVSSHGLDELAKADTVVVPSCREIGEDPPADLVEAVRTAYEAGARVMSICTGAFVLAAAGLLDGRRATTHWMHAAELAARYPRVQVEPDVLYIDEGSVLTSAGKGAGLDLCLHVVRLDHGAAVANALARRLVVPPHREGGQAQFVATPLPPAADNAISGLLAWASARLDQPLTIEGLARQANMSSRNLNRRFVAETGTTPLRWLLTQRVHRAQELLETSDDSIERIAGRTGMGTAATLRRHFNRVLGVPPDTYRRTFHAG